MASDLAKSMTEDQLLAAITEAATLYGWRWVHYRRSDKALMMGNPGLPDIIAVHPSDQRLLFIECKTEEGYMRPGQWDWLIALHRNGARDDERVRAWLVKPSDLDAVLADPYFTGAGL